MKVKCVALRNKALDDMPLSVVGVWRKMDLGGYLALGKEYVVLGIEFSLTSEPDVAPVSILIIPEVGYVQFFDIELFQITDHRVSRYWEAFWPTATNFCLQHPLFNDDDLVEKLIESNLATISAFESTTNLLLSEFNGDSRQV